VVLCKAKDQIEVNGLYNIRVRIDVETVKEKLEDALMEVGRMIVGVGCAIGGSGLLLKGVREGNVVMIGVGSIISLIGIVLSINNLRRQNC